MFGNISLSRDVWVLCVWELGGVPSLGTQRLGQNWNHMGTNVGTKVGPKSGPKVGPKSGPKVGPKSGPKVGPKSGPKLFFCVFVGPPKPREILL